MKKGDKEFSELQAQFEKDIKATRVYSARLDRESKDLKQAFYQDGMVDKLFRAYMLGYEYAKSLSRLDALN